MADRAASGRPSTAASWLPVPAGTMPNGTSEPSSSSAMSRSVPSPPTPMTARTPSASAASTAGRVSASAFVTTMRGAMPSRRASARSTSAMTAARVVASRTCEALGLTMTRLRAVSIQGTA